ncbi:MAG: MoxR family ATPase [Myxococcota bacterium]|jgi:MoxR-like ATPase|nr:MoxR family ATPase [Myxococcota bacterium]
MSEAPPSISLDQAATRVRALLDNIESAVRGKSEVVLQTVTCLIARGHLLIEDVPGVGKTTLARATARSIEADFNRIQFTSDLLPSDLVGVSVPDRVDASQAPSFRFQPGPLFAHVVLADEINRAHPKCQSALLEAMSEQTVSVDGTTHALPAPWFVVATQNPLEHYGTHPLPESQLDRFLMRIEIGYPDRAYEADILREDPAASALPDLGPVLHLDELRAIQELAGQVKFTDDLVAYLLAIVEETRQHEALELGVSPRGAIALRRAAQSRALVDGRDYCIPEDVRDFALPVLTHRVATRLAGGARSADGDPSWVIREIVDRVPVPL